MAQQRCYGHPVAVSRVGRETGVHTHVAVRSPVYPDFDPLALQWRVPRGLRLHVRPCGDCVSVFNEESGDTHIVPPALAELLEALRLRPGCWPSTAWTRSLGSAVGDPGSALRELFALGLIEPVP